MDTTLDGLLDRRVEIEQPKNGFRVAVDTVLLAAAVRTEAGEKVLDLGCGVGGAMLCLACRVPGISITGIEIQSELARLCSDNIARNKFQAEMNVVEGDVADLPSDFSETFDHVMMNPPYHDEVRHDVSANVSKQIANTEKEGDLAVWIEMAAQALKPSGILTLIHRADRMEDILEIAKKHFGALKVLSILPKELMTPKRIILRAQRGMQKSVVFCEDFILHQPNGKYTDEAEAVLRRMNQID